MAAISRMFNQMNEGFARLPEPHFPALIEFLATFNAIFTLNQDLLLENIYLNAQPQGRGLSKRFSRAGVPGVKPRGPVGEPAPFTLEMEPDDKIPTLSDFIQPYFKLHGSSNWRHRDGGEVMIVGGNKDGEIGASPLLKWYFEQFTEYLARPSTKLMVIGYSFRDDHVNAAIERAASQKDLELFLVEPHGLDVFFPPTRGTIPPPHRKPPRRWCHVFGDARGVHY